MKRFFVLTLVSLAVVQIFALQTIRGKIVDANTEQPLDFVNVSLIKNNETAPAAGVVSDGKGQFELPNVPVGNYTLKVSFVGYNTINLPLKVTDKVLEMGMIKLIEDSKNLSEIEVVGQGSQMKFDIDKKIFTVDQNIAAAGGSATEVLQNIPSVDVDNEGNVALRNSSNVEVWINGKPSGLNAENRAQILQQMPAESIESVEIMTNPSAKFNPEGTSGIINIVLKKNRKAGYYGSISAGTMINDGASPGQMHGANINYSSSKVDAYVNLGYRAMSFNGGGTSDRYGITGLDTLSLLHADYDMGRSFSGLFARAGVDYHLTDKHTISLSGFGMLGRGDGNSDITYKITDLTNNTLLRNYQRANTGGGGRENMHMSLDYKYDIDKLGSNLMASLSYSNHRRFETSDYLQSEVGMPVSSNIRQISDGSSKDIDFKLDFTKKFSENTRLELGWLTESDRRFSPNSAVNMISEKDINAYFNEFDYLEQIHAAYATYGTRYGNMSIQGGLRAEYFLRDISNTYLNNSAAKVTDVYDIKPDFQLFPSLYLGYTLPDKNELQLNITRRVNRPRGQQINPFRNFSDSTNISYGNLALNPEYTAAFELNYIKNWDNHTLSASVYHRATDDVIQDVRYLNNGTMETTFMNMTNSKNTGLELVSKNRLFKILNLTSSVNLYRGTMDSAVYYNPYNASIQTVIPAQQNFSWSARMMANFMLSKNTSGQLTADYSAPRLIAQGRETASYAIDLGLRQTFLDKSLSLSLMVRDLLNSRKRNTVTWGEGFYQESSTYFHGRMIGLTATYNFGNMKPKKSQKPAESSGSDMNFED